MSVVLPRFAIADLFFAMLLLVIFPDRASAQPSNAFPLITNQLLGGSEAAPDVNRDGLIDAGDIGFVSRGTPIYRVNSGGGPFTDPDGNAWRADTEFGAPGQTFSTSTSIGGTNFQQLYSTERYQTSGPLRLDLPVEPGRYIVRLHFAEIYHTNSGKRVLDVYLENKLVFDNLDVVAQVGANTAFVFESTADVLDGALSVMVKGVVENPKLSGVEVLEVRKADTERQVIARVNAGGSAFTDALGRQWTTDAGTYNTGQTYGTGTTIFGTTLQSVYKSERYVPSGTPSLNYSFPVPAGLYTVRLHFAEIFVNGPGQRSFDIWTEGERIQAGYDIAARADKFASVVEKYTRPVTDGVLNIEFASIKGDAKVNGIEILRDALYEVELNTGFVQWPPTVLGGITDVRDILLRNPGTTPLRIRQLELRTVSGNGADFFITENGRRLPGSATGVATYDIDVTIEPGRTVWFPVRFKPTTETTNVVQLSMRGDFETRVVTLSGAGVGSGHDSFLHVVIETDPISIDYDGNGSARVFLSGEKSHTHEFQRRIARYEWRRADGSIFSTEMAPVQEFPVGEHTISLTIFDDKDPADTLRGTATFRVVGPDSIPGALVLVYESGEGGPEFFLESIPTNADWGFVSPDLSLVDASGVIEGTPYSGGVMVRVTAMVDLPSAGTYDFVALGGTERRLFVNGNPDEGPLTLPAGTHALEARFAVQGTENLPLSLSMSRDGGPVTSITETITHSQRHLLPVINTMPREGNSLGGNSVTITGIGFFPEGAVAVNWGNIRLQGGDLQVGSGSIRLTAPPGQSLIFVSVVTPNGESDLELYNYTDDAEIPIKFDTKKVHSASDPTQGAWGPDGRLYVGTLSGTIKVFSFDDDYNVSGEETIEAISNLPNNNILGIGFNPTDAHNPVRIYVSHSQLYANGGFCFSGTSPYSGQVSILEGPDFNAVRPLITGLPVSNHDHGINGLAFDNNGDLYVSVGGNTNAGVPDCSIGGLPESPFSAAILKAEISKPNFQGAITYLESDSGNVNMDQVHGNAVDVAPGVDVRVFAAGIRNSFDLTFATNGKLYAVDNGSDAGFGAESTGPNSSQTAQERLEKVLLIEDGNYYGHPNRNRGRHDARQNVFHHSLEGSIAGVYTAPIATLPYSPNGLAEYRAQAFRGSMRGQLLAQVWNTDLIRMALTSDGRGVTGKQLFPTSFKSLDVVESPGGAIIGIDYSGDQIKVAIPNDVGAVGLTVYDITPWRAPTSGDTPFVIGGRNFGDMNNTMVMIGGVHARLTSVSPTRIRGIIPARSAALAELLSVAVTVGNNTALLPNAFRYLGNTVSDTGARATVDINPGLDIQQSSTYWPNSFKVKNTSIGGQDITRVTWDLRTAFIPDIVFDPYGNAGDPVGKDFTVDTSVGGSINHTWASPHDGGFDVLDITFNDFEPNDTLGFSADVDPTSINGAPQPGPNHSGSVSGFEMMNLTVTLYFSDGTALVTHPHRAPGSLVASKNTAKPLTPSAPSIEVVGLQSTPATTLSASQVVRIHGAEGAAVSLVIAEVALYVAGTPGGGFDLDPYEANTVINVDEKLATIPSAGFVDIPVTLKKSSSEAGYNYMVAAIKDSAGDNGPLSNIIVLRLE